MKYRGMHLRGAHVEPLACLVLLKILQSDEVEPRLSRYMQGLAQTPDEKARSMRAQVDAALAEMRATVRELGEHDAELGSSGVGTAEPVGPGSPAESVSPPSGHLTVTAVAERLSVSKEYVRRLCRDTRLSATRRGREWLIEPGSVIEYEATRSTAA